MNGKRVFSTVKELRNTKKGHVTMEIGSKDFLKEMESANIQMVCFMMGNGNKGLHHGKGMKSFLDGSKYEGEEKIITYR